MRDSVQDELEDTSNIYKYAIIIVSLAITIRFLPVVGYSADPAQYAGAGQYYISYFHETGFLYERGSIDFPSSYSASINGVAQDPGYLILVGIASLVANIAVFSWPFRITASILFVIFFSAIGILILRNSMEGSPSKQQYLAIIAFSSVGSPLMMNYITIFSNAPVGWALVCCITVLLPKINRSRHKLMAILLLAVLPFIYYTPSLIIGLFLVFVFLSGQLVPEFDVLSKSQIVLYSVIWLGFAIYWLEARFIGLLTMISSLPSIIGGLLAGNLFSQNSTTILTQYIGGRSSPVMMVSMAIAGLLVATPVGLVLLNARKLLWQKRGGQKVVLAWSFFIPFLAGLFFLWLGSYALDRMQSWGTIAAIICAPIAITQIPKRHRKALVAVLLISAVVTSGVYVNSESRPQQYLTHQESDTAAWTSRYVETNQGIYTDLRLSAPLIGNGRFQVMGVTSYGSPERATKILESLFYGPNPQQTEKVIKEDILFYDNSRPSLYLFSSQMTNPIPGIKGYDYIFKPAPDNFLDKHNIAQDGNVYDNGQGSVYYTDT